MATLAANNAYLEFDSIDLSGHWTDELNYSTTNDAQDVTAGAGVAHKQYAPGLNDTTFSFSVVHDTTDFATYDAALVIGTQATLIYGPEGNTIGNPKFEASAILVSTSMSQSIEKSKVTWELEFQIADVPTATVEGGGTF